MKEKNNLIGILGEEVAVNYLIKKGYKIISRNYKKKFAEIDIIALIDKTIVAVEVKTRKNTNFVRASYAVNKMKQNKIKDLLYIFMQEHAIDNFNIRFDIIECYWQSKRINHIENAF